MKRSEYPQRMCREPVAGEFQNYHCELPDVHPGPHGSFSVVQSVQNRDRWEAENPDWETDIGSADIII